MLVLVSVHHYAKVEPQKWLQTQQWRSNTKQGGHVFLFHYLKPECEEKKAFSTFQRMTIVNCQEVC